MPPAIDLTGKRFGKLVVLGREANAASGQIKWRCRCECGETTAVQAGNLRSGHSTSCGCKGGGKGRDLIGRRFGRLTVLGKSRRRTYGRLMWRCRCECGSLTHLESGTLNSGKVVSCGCYHSEVIAERNRHSIKHGHCPKAKPSPEYSSYTSMKARCLNPKTAKFDLYGGRGITVCTRWKKSFAAFLRDMGPRPEGTTLDRIDSDKNYTPANCRWATPKEQNSNRRPTSQWRRKSKGDHHVVRP